MAWLWGVNGVASVLGSALAVAVAMLIGYSHAIRVGGAVYLLTGIIILLLSRLTAGDRDRGDQCDRDIAHPSPA